MPERRTLRLILLAVVGIASPATAQEVISDQETCPRCTLRLEEVARLGDRAGQELYALPHLWMAEDSSGRFWIPNYSASHTIQVYERDGQFQEFSRRGEGPGEFQRVRALACVNDDFLLMDGARLNRLDPIAGELQFLSQNVAVGSHAPIGAVQVGGDLWLASPSRHPDWIGYPVMVLDVNDGRTLHAYGKEVDHYDQAVERSLFRVLTTLSGNRVVSVGQASYEIRSRATNGQLLRHWVRDASWFRPFDRQALVTGVLPLGDHIIAVTIMTRDPDVEVPDESEGPAESEAWNSIIEVIDLRSGQVLKRLELEEAAYSVICPTNRIGALAMSDHFPVDYLRIYDLVWEDRR